GQTRYAARPGPALPTSLLLGALRRRRRALNILERKTVMPFTQVQEMPNNPPTVRIFLTGQLMLQPNAESNTCEVFVNGSAPNHHLTVEVREKRPGKPDSILMRHHGPLEFRSSDEP